MVKDKNYHKKQGNPATHKDHKFNVDITKDGQIIFNCETCDCFIFVGQLKGFDKLILLKETVLKILGT